MCQVKIVLAIYVRCPVLRQQEMIVHQPEVGTKLPGSPFCP